MSRAPSCVSRLHALGRRVRVGDLCAPGYEIRSSGKCALLDMHSSVPRRMLLDAFWVCAPGRHALALEMHASGHDMPSFGRRALLGEHSSVPRRLLLGAHFPRCTCWCVSRAWAFDTFVAGDYSIFYSAYRNYLFSSLMFTARPMFLLAVLRPLRCFGFRLAP